MNQCIQRILQCCAIFWSVILCSCFDLREEFWLHDDGSAVLEVTCDIPKAATLAIGGKHGLKKMAVKILEKEEAIDSHEVHVSENGKRLILLIRCEIDDLLAIDQLSQANQRQDDLHPAVRKLVGEFDIGMEGMKGISVNRIVSPGEAVPALRWLSKSQSQDYSFVKIMHFPYPIKQHNAHESRDDGCTLIWETTLTNAAKTPIHYAFVIPYPIAWGWIIGTAVSVVIIAAWIYRRIRTRARRRAI